MTTRAALLESIEAGDHNIVRRIWPEVWEALATWWQPRQTCTLRELAPYAKMLGGEDPDDILAAIRECAGDFRPVPGQVLAALKRLRGDVTRVDVGRGRHYSDTPAALEAVADAIRHGERECECGPPTARLWLVASSGVRRCRVCRGLAVEQRYAAEDAGLLDQEAA